MILEGLFLIAVVIAVCVIVYRGAIHEFQILQKDYNPENDWSTPLSEQLPIIIRDLPKHLLGGWTLGKTGNKQWIVYVRDAEKRRLRTTWTEWLKAPELSPDNWSELATVARLDRAVQDWSTESIRRWSWLPPTVPRPYVLPADKWLGVSKTRSEFTAIVATDQAPILIWVAHEGAVPLKVADQLTGKNPWNETTDTIPWISEVKFIEIKLRPGNAVLLPKHWWYAVSANEGNAWFWIAQFHTPISWIVSSVGTNKEQK